MIVVDASVAVKWFLIEAGTRDALALLDQSATELHGPDLLLIEVVGAIVRQSNQRVISREDAAASIRRFTSGWQAGQVRAHRVTDALVATAADLALDLGHPLKDCIYLALALQLGCPLVTADARFRDKAAGRYPAVELLG